MPGLEFVAGIVW